MLGFLHTRQALYQLSFTPALGTQTSSSCSFETRSHRVAQAGLELTILQSQPPKAWCAPLPLTLKILIALVFLGLMEHKSACVHKERIVYGTETEGLGKDIR